MPKYNKKEVYVQIPELLKGNFGDPKLRAGERNLLVYLISQGISSTAKKVRGSFLRNHSHAERKVYIENLSKKQLALNPGITIFETLSYEKGEIKYLFSKPVVEVPPTYKNCFTVELNEYFALRSQYAKILYEYTCSWEKKGKIFIKRSELRRTLGALAETYKMDRNLYYKIVKPALLKINEHTEFSIEIPLFQEFFNEKGAFELNFERKIPKEEIEAAPVFDSEDDLRAYTQLIGVKWGRQRPGLSEAAVKKVGSAEIFLTMYDIEKREGNIGSKRSYLHTCLKDFLGIRPRKAKSKIEKKEKKCRGEFGSLPPKPPLRKEPPKKIRMAVHPDHQRNKSLKADELLSAAYLNI